MAKRYTVAEAQAQLGAILGEVVAGGQPVAIDLDNAASVDLVPRCDPAAEQARRAATWADILAFREELSRARAGQPPITLEDIVNAVHEGREERDRQLDEALGLR